MLLYDIIRNTGAFAALLGGADAIVFIAEQPAQCSEFISDICRGLAFLGLNCRFPATARAGGAVVSDRNSKIKVLVLKEELWRTMDYHSKIAAQEEVV